MIRNIFLLLPLLVSFLFYFLTLLYTNSPIASLGSLFFCYAASLSIQLYHVWRAQPFMTARIQGSWVVRLLRPAFFQINYFWRYQITILLGLFIFFRTQSNPYGRIFWLSQRKDSKKKQDWILFVAGYGCSELAFLPMASTLCQHYPEARIGLYQPNTLFGSIPKHAHGLLRLVRKAHKVHHIDRLLLVGHSMGGLIGFEVLKNMSYDGLNGHLFSIATPWAGTLKAQHAVGENAKMLCPKSEYIHSMPLRLKDQTQQITALGSTHDVIILPPSSAFIPGSSRNIRLQHFGHLELLRAPLVTHTLQQWVKDPQTIALTQPLD